ncbi:MAG: hypothetical protein GX883_08970 [Firmicutes bacterium]|nr:hypothetical protein [Bacillota bacterium]
MDEKYSPGSFCREINCPEHEALESLEEEAYLEKKKNHCQDCTAWRFFLWLEQRNFRVIRTIDEVPAKELAARLKGIDPSTVEHLTIEEILCL